jgi:hypothetical protein
MSKRSSDSNRSSHNRSSRIKADISVDNLFPMEIKSGAKGNRFDVETLFTNTPLNNEPDITFTSDVLLDRIHKRRIEKLKCYKQMLNYCHKKISETDSNNGTDIVVTIVDSFPECKDYNCPECLEYISSKLREEYIDTVILSETTIFVTWYNIELKKEILTQKDETISGNDFKDNNVDNNKDNNKGDDSDKNESVKDCDSITREAILKEYT